MVPIGQVAAAPPSLVPLGPKSSLVLNQPRAQVTVLDANQQPLGPSSNSFLLDTGSNFNLAFRRAAGELKAAGYATEGTFEERGVAGTQTFDVSAPYEIQFTGSDGSGGSLTGIRLLSSDSVEVDPTGGLLSIDGILGMGAMVGRVTTLDNTQLGGGLLGLATYTQFTDEVPADSGHRYTIDVTPIDFPPEGEPPLPTGAPLPTFEARVVDGCNARTASFLLDTGAQFSMISTQVALDLGLDANGNGTITDEAVGFLPIGGVGGTVNAPLVEVPELRLPTREGPELVWTDLALLVVDVDPQIEAIFGADLLGSGEGGLLGVSAPYIEQIHMDFRDLAAGRGQLLFDLAPGKDQVVEPLPVAVGDADGDGQVGPSDLEVQVSHWGREVVAGGACGDFNGDRRVDATDLVMMATVWNGGPAAAPLDVASVLRAVPEPAWGRLGGRLPTGLIAFWLMVWMVHAFRIAGRGGGPSGDLPGRGPLSPLGHAPDR